MSSSSVCQGLQSCLEPRVIEPRVLRLKLTQPGSNFSTPSTTTNKASSSTSSDQENPLTNHECDDQKDTNTVENTEERGWSFLQALTKPTSNCNKTEDDKVYVHPTVKRSSSFLSEKSLEMCTESLGSETGSNAGENCDDNSLFSLENNITTTTTATISTDTTNWASRRVNKACNFPPPLTSITDFGGVRVRPHREGGRLILEAVASPPPRPCFHAERSDGRLRLHLFQEEGLSDDDEEVVDEEEDGVVEEWSDDGDDNDDEVDEESETEIEREKEEEEEECGVVENVEDEMGVKKFNRPSRCKESGNRDIFGDGYFELPSLSLCLLVEFVLLLLSISLNVIFIFLLGFEQL